MPKDAELPDFTLTATGGGSVSKRDLESGRTVLYFYPKDDTPGCTIEGQEFTELYPRFRELGVEVYGVSPDSPKSHDRFIEKCS
ncbi:MAG: peroxiredoxin, partial [Candidatus Dormibacteraeota bacterium]|nr:peroxiredoxin [Candidatus Dormibacteraeota bacterium]